MVSMVNASYDCTMLETNCPHLPTSVWGLGTISPRIRSSILRFCGLETLHSVRKLALKLLVRT